MVSMLLNQKENPSFYNPPPSSIKLQYIKLKLYSEYWNKEVVLDWLKASSEAFVQINIWVTTSLFAINEYETTKAGAYSF